LSSHYSYGFSAHYRRLNHDNPRCQLDSRIALQIPFTYQTLPQIPRGLAFRWPGGYIAHHNCEIGFPGVVASSQSHTTPKADYRGFSTSLEFAKPTSGPILAPFPPTSQDCSQTPPFSLSGGRRTVACKRFQSRPKHPP
jgi:hypothetical protein